MRTKKMTEKAIKKGQKVLVIDGGGRGSALVYAYGKSPQVGEIFAVPGNDLMHDLTDKPVRIFPSLTTSDIEGVLALCREHHVDLVDIAQDSAAAVGMGNALQKAGIAFIGPTKEASQLEWDKAWAREFMKAQGIPHPRFEVFVSADDALAFLDAQPDQPWVVKANGLAEGKGVLVTAGAREARAAISQMSRFGVAGETFLLEQCLVGEEFSTYIISDGTHWQIIGSAQDHKRVGDGDTGANTGGMGCSTPPLLLTPSLLQEISEQIVEKTIAGMKKIGRPYTGILYLGGMVVTENGQQKIYVIEFNARWGDPEAEVLMPGLQSDMFEMAHAVASGDIRSLSVRVNKKARVAVVGASKGYPGDYSAVKGKEIFGLSQAAAQPDITLFGAAVKKVNGTHIANGGRLFHVVGEGRDVIDARAKAYAAMSLISIEGDNLQYRHDIGWRDVARLEARLKKKKSQKKTANEKSQ
jgi:phosphoribosylamine--glycine ligase